MTAIETLRQPLHIPYGPGFDVPPPSARVGIRVQKIMAVIRDAATGEDIDRDALMRRLGIEDPENFDMNVELLGADLYEQMLDALNIEEMGAVQQAMFTWIMPNGSREAAEALLADPTRPAQPNRAVRRRTTKPSTSR